MIRQLAPALFAVLLPGMLAAQSAPATIESRKPDITGAMEEPLVYTPLTSVERWRYLYNNAFAPGALGIHAAAAAFSHTIDSVPEWGQGADGYGRRLGWVVVNNIAQSAIESGVAAALNEDTGYYRCACSGLWRRSAHALVSQILSRRPDGTRSLSFSRPAGAYGGAMVAASILPQRFTLSGDAIRDGTWNYALGFPVNMLREFWPEIRRGVFRKRSRPD